MKMMKDFKFVYVLIMYIFVITITSLISVAVLGKTPESKLSNQNMPKEEKQSSKKLITDDYIFEDTMVNMTWEEIEQESKKGAIVLFPIGVIEEHGPHIDTGSDIYLSYTICKLLKKELEKKNIRSIIARPYYWGINKDTEKFTGSFTVKPETFKNMLIETIECMQKWGFKKIFCTNIHGDPLHNEVLEQAADEANKRFKIDVCKLVDVYNPGKSNLDSQGTIKFPQVREGKYFPEYHAGANETAQMWAFHPDRIDVKIAKALKAQDNFGELGYIGDPANFNLENGREMLNIIVKYDLIQIDNVLNKK